MPQLHLHQHLGSNNRITVAGAAVTCQRILRMEGRLRSFFHLRLRQIVSIPGSLCLSLIPDQLLAQSQVIKMTDFCKWINDVMTKILVL